MKKIGLLLCLIFFVGTVFAQDAQWYFDKGMENYRAENYSQAIPYFEKANELLGGNNSSCQCNIGACYKSTEDYKQAVTWYLKAAQQGFVIAQHNLGECYANGEGVTQDYTQAAVWYRRAAEQGYAAAQFSLGNCYENGEGVTKDPTQAVDWYRKAAVQGNAQAQGALFLCYSIGIGVAKDAEQAKYWGQKAIENEDTNPITKVAIESFMELN